MEKNDIIIENFADTQLCTRRSERKGLRNLIKKQWEGYNQPNLWRESSYVHLSTYFSYF